MLQSSNEAVPAAPNQRSESESASLLVEEVQILRKLASVKKRWWQDFSVLIAAMAFFLSLSTSVISAWTSYRKDIHDQQAQLSRITQAMQDNALQQIETNEKYKQLSPDIRNGITILIGNQYSSLLKNAISSAFELGSNATTGELTTIGMAASQIGNFSDTLRLLNLAVSAANSAVEKSYALRLLGYVQIRAGGSGDMRTKGDVNFKKALELDSEYPDLGKLPPVNQFIKIAAEQHWSLAYAGLDCAKSTIHHEKAQEYLSQVSLDNSDYVVQSLRAMGADVQGTTIAAPPGCAGIPERPEPTGKIIPGQQELKIR